MAILFDAQSSGQFADGSATATFSHTCTGTNLYLEVAVCFGFNSTVKSVVSVTYNGVGMTLVKDSGSASTLSKVVTYGLVAPATGAHNVIATISDDSQGRCVAMAKSYTGVDQATPTGTAVSAVGTTTTPTVNVSSAVGEMVIDAVASGDTDGTLVIGAAQTQRTNISSIQTGVTGIDAGASEEPGGATVTMSWTSVGGSEWAIVAVSLKPGSVGGGFVPDEDFLTFIPARI